MEYATCPDCQTTQELVSERDPARPLATVRVFRAHGAVDLDTCPGSGLPPAPPTRPQGGWRVQIQSREDGILQAPLRLGAYDEACAAADERWLRQGRYRDPNWPAIDASAERWIEYLSPDDVADERRHGAA